MAYESLVTEGFQAVISRLGGQAHIEKLELNGKLPHNKRKSNCRSPAAHPSQGYRLLPVAAIADRWPIAGLHRTRPQHGRLSLIGCKQCRRLQGGVSACASKHRRARRTTLVVRELDDAN